MKSFIDRDARLSTQPARLGAVLSRIDVGKGQELLHVNQMPELLRALAHQTRVESIRASNAIEGVEVEPGRAEKLVDEPRPHIRNRNEREFAGYADAMQYLMGLTDREPPTAAFALFLHRKLYEHSGGGGGRIKLDDNEIVERVDGHKRTIFKPPGPALAETMLRDLMERYNEAVDDRAGHPLVLLGIFILDFLAIHPVADGNGRLSRLLTTHELLRHGYGVARYVSVEQRIFESKNAYYTALEQSQRGWHEASHDIWPWIEYFATILAGAYDDFENRVAAASSTAGLTKQEIVARYVLELPSGKRFQMKDIRRAVPGVSDPTIRIALVQLRDQEKKIEVEGTGRGATWIRL